MSGSSAQFLIKRVSSPDSSSVSPRTDGHQGGQTLQLLLQHQRLPHPADGPGPGPPLPGEQGVPGGSGHAQRQQGASHRECELLLQLRQPRPFTASALNPVSAPLQIHWPASAKRKGECQMTGKGRQVGSRSPFNRRV